MGTNLDGITEAELAELRGIIHAGGETWTGVYTTLRLLRAQAIDEGGVDAEPRLAALAVHLADMAIRTEGLSDAGLQALVTTIQDALQFELQLNRVDDDQSGECLGEWLIRPVRRA